jgi:hypothetical protein
MNAFLGRANGYFAEITTIYPDKGAAHAYTILFSYDGSPAKYLSYGKLFKEGGAIDRDVDWDGTEGAHRFENTTMTDDLWARHDDAKIIVPPGFE